jgi:hypothetical protein
VGLLATWQLMTEMKIVGGKFTKMLDQIPLHVGKEQTHYREMNDKIFDIVMNI